MTAELSPSTGKYRQALEDPFACLRTRVGDADAIPVCEKTIADAKMLLDGLPSGIRFPHLAPSAEGEIGLSWAKGQDRFEAMLQPDDHLVWVSKVSDSYIPGADVIVSSSSDRETFYASLSEFYGRT